VTRDVTGDSDTTRSVGSRS